MKFAINSSRDTSNLPPGHYAEPGIYVVTHRDPAHTVPHEVLVQSLTILPICRLCSNVRYSLKGRLPKPITEHHMLWSVSEETSAKFRAMAAEMRAFAVAAQERVEDARDWLHWRNGHS